MWLWRKNKVDAPPSTHSKRDALRHAALKLVLTIACAITGGFALWLALDMVSIYGEGMGTDTRSQKLYARAHVAVHVFGTISAILIPVFRASGNKGLATLSTIFMLLCGGYGVVNMIGFASTNRLAVAEAKIAANKADERQYQAAVAAKKEDIAWTRKTIISEEHSREKRRLEAELAKKEKELADLKPPKPTAATVLADSLATLFSKLVGWTVEGWQMALPIPMAFLLFSAEVFSFFFAMHLLIGAMADWRASRQSRGDRGGLRLADSAEPATSPAAWAEAIGSASVPPGYATDAGVAPVSDSAGVPPGYATDAGVAPVSGSASVPPGYATDAGVAPVSGSASVPPGYATDAGVAPVSHSPPAKTPAASGHNHAPDRRRLFGLPQTFTDASKRKATRDQVTELLRQGQCKSDAALARETGCPRETIRDMRRRMKQLDKALGDFQGRGGRSRRT